MCVLNVISSLSGGGAERQLMYIAPELVKRGYKVNIAYITEGPSDPSRILTLNGISLHKLSTRSNYNPFLVYSLVKLIRLLKPKIVQTWSIQMDVLAGLAARITNTPCILREPNCSECYNDNWKNKIRLFIGKQSDAIISNSMGGDDYWNPHVPLSKRYIIHNGLPIDRIMQIPVLSLLNFGLDENSLYLLFAGRLEPGKNLKKLLEALKIVMVNHNIDAIFCGDGSDKQALVELSKFIGIENKIHFLGYVQSEVVWSLMKGAAAFIFVSEFEGMPNVLVEAMLCESPLIVSNIKAHLYMLDDSMAIFVDPHNINSIADAIINVLRYPCSAKKRSYYANCQAIKYSISSMTDSYIQVYEKIQTSQQLKKIVQ